MNIWEIPLMYYISHLYHPRKKLKYWSLFPFWAVIWKQNIYFSWLNVLSTFSMSFWSIWYIRRRQNVYFSWSNIFSTFSMSVWKWQIDVLIVPNKHENLTSVTSLPDHSVTPSKQITNLEVSLENILLKKIVVYDSQW
jgi:hypothetical protein